VRCWLEPDGSPIVVSCQLRHVTLHVRRDVLLRFAGRGLLVVRVGFDELVVSACAAMWQHGLQAT
jgi:hypothetical protein